MLVRASTSLRDMGKLSMVHPASRRSTALRRWIARWYGPVFTLVGLIWLGTIAFTTGSRNDIALRVILGVIFVIIGIASTITYIKARRRDQFRAASSSRTDANPET